MPARLKLRPNRLSARVVESCDDYTILVPIFGNVGYLKNVDFLAPYGDKVVLCTTSKETPEFEQALQGIADRHRFRIFKSHVARASARGRPSPWKLLSRTLNQRGDSAVTAGTARDEIIRDSFARIRSTFTIFLDGDTTAAQDFGILAGLAKSSNFDVASVRVLASRTDTLAEKLQAVEYEAAMNSRMVYPWLTSGACLIGKTRVLQSIMHHHSLFFSGGDIEVGKLAKMLKYRVGHVPFELYTDVPQTFRAWFRQRMAWCGGGFRHAIVNSHRYNWRHPFYYVYTTIIVYALTPLRWYELLAHPHVLLIVIPVYWAITIMINWGKLRWYLALHPFYCLVQVMVIVPLGAYTYFKMVKHSRNIGHIRLRPRHKARSGRRFQTTPRLQSEIGR
jgi:hypothetical protein